MKNSARGFIGTLTLIIIALVIIGGGYYVWTNHSVQSTASTVSSQPISGTSEYHTASIELKQGGGNPTILLDSPLHSIAPFTVTFVGLKPGASDQELDFGDGQKLETNGKGEWPSLITDHTYAQPGVYTAVLYGSMPHVAMSKVVLAIAPATQFATITNALTQSPGTVTLSGTAIGVASVQVGISVPGIAGEGYADGAIVSVTNGKWSAILKNVPAGTYIMDVFVPSPKPDSMAPTFRLAEASLKVQ